MDAKAEKQLRYLLDAHFAAAGMYDDVELIDDVQAFVDDIPSVVPGSLAERPSEGYFEVHLKGCSSLLEPPGTRLICSMAFNGCRYESEIARTSETCAAFDTRFVFKVQQCGGAPGGTQDNTTTRVLSRADGGGPPAQVHAVLVRVDSYGLRTAVGEGMVEWRGALAAQKIATEAELRCAGFPLAVATLECECEYVPVHGKAGLLSEEGGRELMQAIAHGIEQQHTLAHVFANRAKQWRRAIPTGRHVALETVANQRLVPVTAFVSSLPSQRVFDTPHHAAHFVTLLRTRDDPATDDVTGAALADDWTSLHTLMATKACRLNERAALLCSLLLGFGLDAWVVCGVDSGGCDTYWVLTREVQDAVVFWDPLSARREAWASANAMFAKGEVHGVFNDTVVYANLQDVSSGEGMSFAFEAPDVWRVFEMDDGGGRLVGFTKHAEMALVRPPDMPPSDDLEVAFEQELVLGILEYRSNIGLGGIVMAKGDFYDVMGQALWQHATEQLVGQPTGADGLFLAACQHHVPRRHTLKAFPTHLAHTQTAYVIAHLLSHAATKDLLETSQHNTTITLRARIAKYPEGLVSVWLLLAAVYSNL